MTMSVLPEVWHLAYLAYCLLCHPKVGVPVTLGGAGSAATGRGPATSRYPGLER